jgi:5-deoxy-glucuronate isomerase
MHLAPFDNHNRPIVDAHDPLVPLCYFNIVKLRAGESFASQVPGYETCIVPATGTIDIEVMGETFSSLGLRRLNVWDAEPEGAYVPTGAAARITATTDAEIFIAGAAFDEVLAPFAIRADEIDKIQYGSDETKTHRQIKHILGTKYHGRVGRLLVSELYTVGAGGWSGFPSHKHDEDRMPIETRHDEVYNFRFNPPHGSGVQMLQREEGKSGDAYHLVDGSTICIDKGYHPCAVLPGYEMYYFTILGGLSQRSLVQYFQPSHADQIETIPGIKDMIAKFK